MFNLSINRELEKVAKRASLYAKGDNHREAARMRRLTRHAAWKTDKNLERLIDIVFAWAAFIAIAGILLYIKLYR